MFYQFVLASQLQITANLARLPVHPDSSRTTSSIWSTSTAISSSKLNKIRPSQVGTDMSTLERPKVNGRLEVETPSRMPSDLHLKRISVEVEPEKPVDMSWPSTLYKRFIYILLAPIMFPLYLTLPDVKRPVRNLNTFYNFLI